MTADAAFALAILGLWTCAAAIVCAVADWISRRDIKTYGARDIRARW